jgi:hypothetical protein
LLYDNLQRSFIDNGKGTGRIAWSTSKVDFPPTLPNEWLESIMDLIGRFYNCLMGPTRNEMEKLIELNNLIDKMMAKTPWEISASEEWSNNYYKEIQKIWDREKISIGMQLFCRMGHAICTPVPKNWPLFNLYHETKAKTEALITTLAILRFKNDYNRLTETLVKLVSEGYLKSLPRDPYNNGPLTYEIACLAEDSESRREGDDFILYSVGKDFIDDGGVFKRWVGPVFGPTKETTSDIIYWPVESLDKAQYEEIQKQTYERAREFGPPPVSRE